jgi:hypothetical protein
MAEPVPEILKLSLTDFFFLICINLQQMYSFAAPERVYEVHTVSGLNQDLEVNWTPPIYTPKIIRRYKVSYQVGS